MVAPSFYRGQHIIIIEIAKFFQRYSLYGLVDKIIQRRLRCCFNKLCSFDDALQHLFGSQHCLVQVHLPVHESPGD